MPRVNCEMCRKEKIVYRLYVEGTFGSVEVGQKCAVRVVRDGLVFNLRRIRRADLGTLIQRDDAETNQ